MSLRRALLCTVGLVGSSALPTGEHHSFGSMIALLATQDDQQQVATEPGTHLGQVTSIMAKSTVDLATAVAEAIPGYWLAFAMVVVVVVIFMLCWCVLALLTRLIAGDRENAEWHMLTPHRRSDAS